MEIRKEIKDKLFHFYEKTFGNLEKSLNDLGELDFYLLMNSSQSITKEGLSSSGSINPNENLEYNTLLLTQEIFDDFGGALNCFIVGYFKQTQVLLRNSVESMVQIWKNKISHLDGGVERNSWIQGIRGIEKIDDACKEIENLEDSVIGIKEQIRKLNKLYSKLCKSTHSHKSRLNSKNSPRPDSTLKGLTFEPLEFLYTKIVFIYTLILILKLLLLFFNHQNETDWRKGIIETLKLEIKRLNKEYANQVQNYEKGYIIFQESLKLTSDKKIELYSVDLEGNFKELTRKKSKLNKRENKILETEYQKRLLQDK